MMLFETVCFLWKANKQNFNSEVIANHESDKLTENDESKTLGRVALMTDMSMDHQYIADEGSLLDHFTVNTDYQNLVLILFV